MILLVTVTNRNINLNNNKKKCNSIFYPYVIKTLFRGNIWISVLRLQESILLTFLGKVSFSNLRHRAI